MFCTEKCNIHLKEFATELENIATDMKSEALLKNKIESLNKNKKELNSIGISESKKSGKCFRFFYFSI